MARTRLGLFLFGLVGILLTAAAVQADDKALRKQLDDLNQLTGGNPTSGALRGVLSDKKQMKELLAFAVPFAKKKEISYNAAFVLALAAADEKDMKTAEIFFRVCMDQAVKLKSYPKLRQSYFVLSELYYDYKQYADAVRICRELLELNTNDGKERVVYSTALDRFGNVEIDYDNPKQTFTATDMLRDEMFEVLIKATAMQGKHEQALKLVDNLLKRQNDVYNQRLKAWVLRESGKLGDAAGIYESLIKKVSDLQGVDPRTRDRFVDQMRYEASNVYVELNQINKASEHLEYLLKKNPDKAAYCNDLGYIWADHDMKLDEAEKLIRKAIDLDRAARKKSKDYDPKTDHDSGAYLDSLGWVLFKQKKNQEAKEWLLKAVEDKAAQHIEIYDHLGDVLVALGERAAAIRAYEDGLKHVNEGRRDQERKAAVEKKLEKLKNTK